MRLFSTLLMEIVIPVGIQLYLIWYAWKFSPKVLIGTMWDDFFLLLTVIFLGMPTDARFFPSRHLDTASNLTTNSLKGWLKNGKYNVVFSKNLVVSIFNFMAWSEEVFTYNLSAISKASSVFTIIPYILIETAVLNGDDKKLGALMEINYVLIFFLVAMIVIKVKSVQMQSLMGAR